MPTSTSKSPLRHPAKPSAAPSHSQKARCYIHLHIYNRLITCAYKLCAELLLPDCVRFSCCSPRDCIDPFQLLLSSRLASASAASRHLRPLQLLLSIVDCVRSAAATPFVSASTLLPDGVRFVCCSLIASTSTAAPRLQLLRLLLLASCSGRFQPYPLFSNILCRVRSSVN